MTHSRSRRMRKLFCLCAFITLSIGIGQPASAQQAAPPAADCDTLVFCPELLQPALKPWIEYRQRQGYRILVARPAADAWGIKRQIRNYANEHPLRNIVLIGDTPDMDGRNARFAIATDYVLAKVVGEFGSEPEIATDNTYADLDSDGIPDLTIGRMPADTPEQLGVLVQKIIRYESAASGAWQRQINLIAGTGGFGPLSDGIIEKASRGMISELIPQEYSVSLTWANWSSAFCPDPRVFRTTTIERLNEGCLFWVYMGHGQPHGLDYVRTPIGGYPMFMQNDVSKVNCTNGLPVALMLACYNGAFDFPDDCLAEQLVLQPGGPIAAVCSSRVAMPYGMSGLSLGLIEEYFNGGQSTLGEMMLVSKRKLVESNDFSEVQNELERPRAIALMDQDDQHVSHKTFRHTIRVLSETFSPVGDCVAEESREHVHLFHLLGDPLLKMKRPEFIQLAAEADANDSSVLVVSGRAPRDGQVLLELEYARDRTAIRIPRRLEFDSEPGNLDQFQKVYEQANKRLIASKLIDVRQGRFETRLEFPEWARGRCVVRGLMASGTDRIAMGASDVQLKQR